MATAYVPYDGPIVTRVDALAAGLTRFFTGRPCKHGHLSQRTSANGGCIRCNQITGLALFHGESSEERQERNARQRAWKDAHREAVRAEGRRYSREHREQSNAWKAANRDRVNALEREANKRNPEAAKARSTRYHLANPEVARVITQRRRALKLKCEGSHTAADIRGLLKLQRGKCAYCRVSLRNGYHVDHIRPLSRGGSNCISNIQLTCAACNRQKHAADPIEYAQRIGLLI